MISESAFRLVAGHWPTGVAVVTTIDAAGRLYGMTMNAVTALSLTPPQFLVCVDRGSDTGWAIEESGVFCINYLSANQTTLSKIFARKGEDKFADVEIGMGVTGSPLLNGVVGFIECHLAQSYDGGDHKICIGKVAAAEILGGEPLIYYCGGYRKLGP